MNHADLRIRSVQIILDHQQSSGAYLACPNMPDYNFSWFRDGAFIAYALTVDGLTAGLGYDGSMAAQWESAGSFHEWCASIITDRAAAIERGIQHVQQGLPVPPEETINARYRADGSVGPLGWPEFQLDGPGMWLWSLAHYLPAARIKPLPTRWIEAVDLVARYLDAMWQQPCYDFWEERGTDIHTGTLAAIYAGLVAAGDLLGTTAYAASADAVRAFVLEKGLTPDGELAKSVGLDMVDANLISTAVPFGLLSPDDPHMQRTIARIERELVAPGHGVHRHLEDEYYGGGAWVLLALWLAWYYVEAGQTEKARAIYDRVAVQADAAGNLPEQVNSAMLRPNHFDPWVAERGPIANPLLWTHAKYLIVRAALNGCG